MFYKWTEQAGRYFTATTYLYETYQSRSDQLNRMMKTVTDEITQYGLSLPQELLDEAVELLKTKSNASAREEKARNDRDK